MLRSVRTDFGSEAADSSARRLVLPVHRTQEQAQYIERPVLKSLGTRLSPLLDLVRGGLARRWAVTNLAKGQVDNRGQRQRQRCHSQGPDRGRPFRCCLGFGGRRVTLIAFRSAVHLSDVIQFSALLDHASDKKLAAPLQAGLSVCGRLPGGFHAGVVGRWRTSVG